MIAGLRSYNIGIDLTLHYSRTYSQILNLSWEELPKYAVAEQLGGYDIGYLVFCKLLGYISSDVQWYIFSTSLIVYGAIGVYIYLNP